MERPIKGGYILVSLGLIPLSTSYSGSIDYDRISRTKKHIVLTGIKVGDTVMPDICVKPVYGNGTITFEDVYGFDVVVKSDNSVEVSEYEKNKIDGDLEVTGEITAKKITGDEIIEDMNGYSIRKFAKENLTHDIVYAGVVKNGNKITFVLFEKVTRTGDVANNFYDPCAIYIPKVVADKIIPTPLGTLENAVSSKVVNLFSTPNSAVSVNAVVTKREESGEIYGLQPFIYGLQNLVLNQEYQYRLEVTFLLSESLVTQ